MEEYSVHVQRFFSLVYNNIWYFKEEALLQIRENGTVVSECSWKRKVEVTRPVRELSAYAIVQSCSF